MRTLFGYALRFGLPLGTERVSLQFSTQDPFVKFLSSVTGNPEKAMPELGILASNSASENERFLLLLFDKARRPSAVVKCGASAQARELVQHEETFLTAALGKVSGISRLRGQFDLGGLRAFATDYFPGGSPTEENELTFPSLLSSWINSSTTMRVIESPGWLRLEKACSGNEMVAALRAKLDRHLFHPAIYHGDFVPWNIRVAPDGQWHVLDWERGEISGTPAWDVFHYVLQPAILVQRLPMSALETRAERLLVSDSFRAYLARAGIAGFERELLLAYLLHCAEVIQPSEGLVETKALLNALWRNWMLSTGLHSH
jgi:hypothetical protein